MIPTKYYHISIVVLLNVVAQIGLLGQPSIATSTTAPPDPNSRPECKDTDPDHVSCDFNKTCVYGESNTVDCHVDDDTYQCKGKRSFEITFPCLYCWQLPEDHYTCSQNTSCKIHTRYLASCVVNSTTYCLGRREFSRYKQCNIVTGHKWSTALVLSVLFGGFGADRFYLGHWQEGVGKLFSFGGFGVWTLIDTILISIGYLKPADSSHYG